MSWKSEVRVNGSNKWFDNDLRFATEAEAYDNVRDLACKWMAVTDYRATECDDPVNYQWVNGKLVAIEKE